MFQFSRQIFAGKIKEVEVSAKQVQIVEDIARSTHRL